MSSNRFSRQRNSSKKGTEEDSLWRPAPGNDTVKSDDSQSRTITPTSSQEEDKRKTPAQTKSWLTRSANDRKPWLESQTSPEGSQVGSRKPMRRGSTGDENILHTPSLSHKRLTMPHTPDSEVMDGNEPTKSFDDLWDESLHTAAKSHEYDKGKKISDGPKPRESATEKKKATGEVDTSKFAKVSRTPPNTPSRGAPTAETTSTCFAEDPRKKNSFKHPRKPRSRAKEVQPAKINEKGTKKDGEVSTSQSKDVAEIEKQLERVNFLQKRQFDQLSSLKKMLLSSRAKEKDYVKSNEEWKTKAEVKDNQIAALKMQLDQCQSALHLSKQKFRQSATAAIAGGDSASSIGAIAMTEMQAELVEKDARIARLEEQLQEMESKRQVNAEANDEEVALRLQSQQSKVAELEQRLGDLEKSHKEAVEQLQNTLASTESKLRKKMEQAEQAHEEMEEMREQLTAANSNIEQLEEERNYSMAKMAELNDMVASKGGISDTKQELIDRAAEIINLTSKVNAAEGKINDRDDKIFKLEAQISSINELVKQLSDGFVGTDEELRKNQELLLESATSPVQSTSLLLMTMMNMLDSLKAKLVTLQKERDDMNAKAADRGIQLAESHIRVDKLRTELRRMRAERERARGGRGPGGLAYPNDPRRPQQASIARPQQAAAARPRNASQQSGSPGGFHGSETNAVLNSQSERDKLSVSTRTAPPVSSAAVQKPSRFMSFLKGGLAQEMHPQSQNGKQQDQNAPPVIVNM